MPTLVEAFPDAKALLALEPEELGDVIVELIHRGISPNPGRFGLHDFLYAVNHRDTPEWPSSVRGQVTQAVAEALAYLEQAGLVISDPTQSQPTLWRIFSRRGQKLSEPWASRGVQRSCNPAG
jgi:hypothetical protein